MSSGDVYQVSLKFPLQGRTDLCSAFATSAASKDKNNVGQREDAYRFAKGDSISINAATGPEIFAIVRIDKGCRSIFGRL